MLKEVVKTPYVETVSQYLYLFWKYIPTQIYRNIPFFNFYVIQTNFFNYISNINSNITLQYKLENVENKKIFRCRSNIKRYNHKNLIRKLNDPSLWIKKLINWSIFLKIKIWSGLRHTNIGEYSESQNEKKE